MEAIRMNDHYIARAKVILEKVTYATIATVSEDDKPWNSPVRHNYDEDLNIYWFSDKQNQHSQNVRANGNVFIVIYDSTVPEGEGCGVYLECKAYELDDSEEIRKARRLKKGPIMDAPDDFTGDAVRRVYKAVPQRVWLNDAEIENGKFIRDYRVELSLKDLRESLK